MASAGDGLRLAPRLRSQAGLQLGLGIQSVGRAPGRASLRFKLSCQLTVRLSHDFKFWLQVLLSRDTVLKCTQIGDLDPGSQKHHTSSPPPRCSDEFTFIAVQCHHHSND